MKFGLFGKRGSGLYVDFRLSCQLTGGGTGVNTISALQGQISRFSDIGTRISGSSFRTGKMLPSSIIRKNKDRLPSNILVPHSMRHMFTCSIDGLFKTVPTSISKGLMSIRGRAPRNMASRRLSVVDVRAGVNGTCARPTDLQFRDSGRTHLPIAFAVACGIPLRRFSVN